MKKKIIIICLLSIVTLFTRISISSVSEKHGDIMPPDILPVIFLSGTDYEMGYQYGLQAGQYIEINKNAAWASALQNYSYSEVLNTLKINQFFIKEYTPENIEIMKGMTDGAKAAGYDISYIDIVLLNVTIPDPKTSTYPKDAGKDELPPDKSCSVCSAWGTATKKGRLLGLDTLDGFGEARFGVILVVFPKKGNNYICGADAGEIGDHFLMNNKGLFFGNSGGGGSPRKIDNNYGICWATSMTHIVRFANNAVEAKDMILSWQINTPENFHFVDVHGNSFVVEKTAAIQAVRKSGDFGEKDFLFSTNNYLHKKMKVTKEGDFIKKHGGYGAYSAPRNLIFWDLLNNYHSEIDVEFMKMILRFPGNPPPYPPEEGWDAKICRPTNNWVSVLLPDNGDKGIANVCTGPAGRIIHSSTASSGEPMRTNYPYIDGTHTFFKIRLAANPKAVVEQAKTDAINEIATAYKEFMKLTPLNDGYGELQKIYSKANREYYQGNQLLNEALLASGNESLILFSKAGTAYTRSQAHAAQVFEALVPPATSPSDLGLKTFGGDWGIWETSFKH
ncbi:C45 family autoproteolytic acyltransferase/hydrolase [Bacteroidota bacterium]